MNIKELTKQKNLLNKPLRDFLFVDSKPNGMFKKIGIASGITAAGALAIASYPLLIRPWQHHWGATKEEMDRPMPGDEKIPHPEYETTRAITIEAEPEKIWPWLMKMGYSEDAQFSYEWLDKLFGYIGHTENSEGTTGSKELKEGDVLPVKKSQGFPIQYLEQFRYLVLGKQDDGYGWTWSMGLYQVDKNKTRFVSRNRLHLKDDIRTRTMEFLLDPASFLMARKWMAGIKNQAEKLAKGETINVSDE